MTSPAAGDFAVASAGAIGALISFGEWADGSGFTQWDHAFIYVGNNRIVQTNPGGAREIQISGWKAGRADVLWSTDSVNLTSDERAAIVKAALGYAAANVHYSALDYLALAAHRLHLPVPWLRDYIASSGHMICSQLVDQCYRDAGVELFSDKRWPGYVTPADLGNLIERKPLFGLRRTTLLKGAVVNDAYWPTFYRRLYTRLGLTEYLPRVLAELSRTPTERQPMNAYITHLIQVAVAAAVGGLVGMFARWGLHLPAGEVAAISIAVTGLVTTAYLHAVQGLEKRYPWLGWLLGVKRAKAAAK